MSIIYIIEWYCAFFFNWRKNVLWNKQKKKIELIAALILDIFLKYLLIKIIENFSMIYNV